MSTTADITSRSHIDSRLNALAGLAARGTILAHERREASDLAVDARVWCEELRKSDAADHEIVKAAGVALSLDAIAGN